MSISSTENMRSWRDWFRYHINNSPFKSKSREKEMIHTLSSLVCDTVLQAAPHVSRDRLVDDIAETISLTIHANDQYSLRGLFHREPTEAEVFAVKAKGESTRNVVTRSDASAAPTPDTEEVTVKAVKDTAKDSVKDTAKDSVKDTAKDSVKDTLMSKLKTYFAANYAFRYNILTRESEMKPLNAADGNDAQQYTVIGKREENTLVISAQEAGINCWDADVKRLINSANTVEYHPFIEYFNTLPEWDGKDRVGELARRVSDKKLWVNSFHRWMLALTAQWMNYRTESSRANCVAPLLISTEQGWGKSTFCRMIMPSPLRRYYTESFDLASQSSCEAKLADFGLINLDEFDKITAKKMPTLKNLMQEQALNIKRAYQQGTTPLHRIASFIGTSNSRDLLTDRSGSRRFICVELEKEIDCETPIDYAQLYAQLKEEVTVKHERTYFTKEEERKIQESNRLYYHTSVEEELFYRHFRFAERTDENAIFMTASEIFKHLKREDGALLRGVTPAQFARLLPGIGQRVHTKLGNGYFVEVLKEE